MSKPKYIIPVNDKLKGIKFNAEFDSAMWQPYDVVKGKGIEFVILSKPRRKWYMLILQVLSPGMITANYYYKVKLID